MPASSSTFADHFGTVARQYAHGRPRYPGMLFDWLATQCPRHDAAWDCATGSGQAARDLARVFAQVFATDASAAQIANAEPCTGIDYRVASAEASGLPDACVDAVVVAQALHWFDVEAFHREAVRVLRPGGLLAEWCYGLTSVDSPALDAQVQRFYRDVVGRYWPPERRHVENAYADLPFPFARVAAPAFEMRAEWTLAQFGGYLSSWSASARYIAVHGQDPVAALLAAIAPDWGPPPSRQTIRWPLSIRVGRV